MTIPLSPQVSLSDILAATILFDENRALWLDHECVLVSGGGRGLSLRYERYLIELYFNDEPQYIMLAQVPGTTEVGAPLPALEYLIDRLTSYDGINAFCIRALYKYDVEVDDDRRTLDVSPACFSNMLQTSHRCFLGNVESSSVMVRGMSLKAEQTALLFTHATSPIFIDLLGGRYHGPTILQLGSAALRQEQAHRTGRDSYLRIALANDDDNGDEFGRMSLAELTALLSIPHLRNFRPFWNSEDVDVPYEKAKKLVFALAANTISSLESLTLESCQIEWEKKEEASMWIHFWQIIEAHHSLKEIHIETSKELCQQSWWQPIEAAVKVNPRIFLVRVLPGYPDREIEERSRTWHTQLDEHVFPLLLRNQYSPRISALCRTDPSLAVVLLGQAIVSAAGMKCACKKCANCILQIHYMLVKQLVVTPGYNVPILGNKRQLAATDVVVPSDAFATKTEPRVADCKPASTNDSNNES